MKAKINQAGSIQIERAGEFVEQKCPFNPPIIYQGVIKLVNCGDWCPLFVEIKNAVGEKGYLDVKLACGTAVHEIVSDERKATAS